MYRLVATQDLAFCAGPPKSPDLTLCDLFLWRYIKDNFFVLPVTIYLNDLKHQTITAIYSVDQDILLLDNTLVACTIDPNAEK